MEERRKKLTNITTTTMMIVIIMKKDRKRRAHKRHYRIECKTKHSNFLTLFLMFFRRFALYRLPFVDGCFISFQIIFLTHSFAHCIRSFLCISVYLILYMLLCMYLILLCIFLSPLHGYNTHSDSRT